MQNFKQTYAYVSRFSTSNHVVLSYVNFFVYYTGDHGAVYQEPSFLSGLAYEIDQQNYNLLSVFKGTRVDCNKYLVYHS